VRQLFQHRELRIVSRREHQHWILFPHTQYPVTPLFRTVAGSSKTQPAITMKKVNWRIRTSFEVSEQVQHLLGPGSVVPEYKT
jgi:hypothetical protein